MKNPKSASPHHRSTGTCTPQKKSRADTTRRLLEAGLEVFSQFGFDAATTKLVSQRAGINESLINRYFEGKEGILLAIVREFTECEKAEGALAHYPPGETPEKDILSFFETMIEHHVKLERIFRVMLSRAIVDTRVRDILTANLHRGGYPRLLKHLSAFRDRGLIRADVDIEKTCFTITQAGFSMGMLGHIVMGMELDYVRGALREFARNISRGIAAKPTVKAKVTRRR